MTTYRFSAKLWSILPSEILQENWPLAQTIIIGSDQLRNAGMMGDSDLDFVNFLCSDNASEIITGLLEEPMRTTLLALVGRKTELLVIYHETNSVHWK